MDSRKFRPQQFWCTWKTKLKARPEADEYPDTPADIRALILEDMKAHGFDPHFPIVLAKDGHIAAGRCRYACAQEAKIDFLTVTLPATEDIAKFCEREQDNRKHLTQEWLQRKRQERIERVAAARGEGKSTRAIAEEEHISQPQVRRDLEKAGETGVSPETNGKTLGKDEKIYPAKKEKVLCPSCQTRMRKQQALPAKCQECKALREAKRKDKGNNPDADVPPETPKAPPMDDLGNELPKRLRDAFAGNRTTIKNIVALLFEARRMLKGIKDWNPYIRQYETESLITKAVEDMKNGLPYCVCQDCEGKGCAECRKSGWIPKWCVKAEKE